MLFLSAIVGYYAIIPQLRLLVTELKKYNQHLQDAYTRKINPNSKCMFGLFDVNTSDSGYNADNTVVISRTSQHNI
jgi:hypothetical protein